MYDRTVVVNYINNKPSYVFSDTSMANKSLVIPPGSAGFIFTFGLTPLSGNLKDDPSVKSYLYYKISYSGSGSVKRNILRKIFFVKGVRLVEPMDSEYNKVEADLRAANLW
jgi:hypothetical protein